MATSRHTGPLVRPDRIAVFPLDGALLLPGRQLPLNIFEPRYLNMIDDALAGPRCLGMIQTDGTARQTAEGKVPGLAGVGCLGRITQFSETDDGRYMVVLTGLSRFAVTREVGVQTPYRQADVDYSPYLRDSRDPGPHEDARSDFMVALRAYAKLFPVEVEWEAFDRMNFSTLVDEMALLCPFDRENKQRLLEATTFEMRRALLVDLFRLAVLKDGDGGTLQ